MRASSVRPTRPKKAVFLVEDFENYYDALNQYNTEDVSVYLRSFAEEKYQVADLIKGNYAAFFSPLDHYGEHYLTEVLIGFRYSNAGMVGMAEAKTEEFTYTDALPLTSAVVERAYVAKESVKGLNAILERKVSTPRLTERAFAVAGGEHVAGTHAASGEIPNNAIGDKVTIVVPVYNVDFYLERCLDSLLRQTYPNIEIIVVDDGSPDSSGEISERYVAKYPGLVRCLHKKNGGMGSATNAGLKESTGHTSPSWTAMIGCPWMPSRICTARSSAMTPRSASAR